MTVTHLQRFAAHLDLHRTAVTSACMCVAMQKIFNQELGAEEARIFQSGRQESRKGISEIEGKAARIAAKKRGLRLSFKAGKDRGFECCRAFDSIAPAQSVCRPPVHVAHVPAAPFCESRMLSGVAQTPTI